MYEAVLTTLAVTDETSQTASATHAEIVAAVAAQLRGAAAAYSQANAQADKPGTLAHSRHLTTACLDQLEAVDASGARASSAGGGASSAEMGSLHSRLQSARGACYRLEAEGGGLQQKSAMASVFEQGMSGLRSMLEAEIEKRQDIETNAAHLQGMASKLKVTSLPERLVQLCMACKQPFSAASVRQAEATRAVIAAASSARRARGRVFCLSSMASNSGVSPTARTLSRFAKRCC